MTSYVLVMLKIALYYNARFIFKCVFVNGSDLSEIHSPNFMQHCPWSRS